MSLQRAISLNIRRPRNAHEDVNCKYMLPAPLQLTNQHQIIFQRVQLCNIVSESEYLSQF